MNLETATELKGHLTSLAKLYDVEDIADTVLQNNQFFYWSGAGKPHQHHYGDYGLITHTAEVIALCLSNNAYFEKQGKSVNNAALFLAALFHDIGKTWDYAKVDGVWGSTDHKYKIYHVSRSGIVWMQAVSVFGDKYQSIADDVYHAILAHHGRREWGSPVEPVNRLAWLVHLCDNMSARMYDCETFKREW